MLLSVSICFEGFFDKEINLQGYVTTVHFPAASKCLKKKIGQFHQRILGQDFSLFFLLKIRDMYVSVLSICITFLYENWRISSQFMYTFSKVGMTWTYDPWSIQILFYANKAIHLEVLNSLICMNFSKPKPWTRENIHFQMREKNICTTFKSRCLFGCVALLHV